MKMASASTKTPGATDACTGCSDFASQGSVTQSLAPRCSARRVVNPKHNDLGPRRLARVAMELGWLFGSDFISNRRSSRAAEDLIRALDRRAAVEPDDMDAQVFEGEATEWLTEITDSVTSGFGEFEARFSIDGTVTFVGEPDAVSQVLLQIDHHKNFCRRRLRPDLPRYRIEVRSTGKWFDCWSLNGALHVLQQTKTDAIKTFCVEAQVRCYARRGGAA